MGLGDLLGGAAEAFGAGGIDEIVAKIGDSGIDLAALKDMDLSAVPALLAENGIDLSILESLGISLEDVIAKVTERFA